MAPSTVHVTSCAGLFVPVTVAVKLCVVPLVTVAVSGATVTLSTVGVTGASCTVTVAVPDFEVSTVEVAFTVSVAAVSPAVTVSSPLPSMVLPVPPVTSHVTPCAGLFVPVTVAVKFCVVPLVTVTMLGLTVTLSTVGALVPTTMLKSLVASGLVPLLACTLKLKVPAAAGVPLITPVVGLSARPVGRLPPAMLQVIGVEPVAVSVSL